MKKGKLFKNGDSQAIRLPKEYRFEGKEVYIEKTETGVILIPENNAWAHLENSLTMFSDDILIERNQPTEQKRNFDL